MLFTDKSATFFENAINSSIIPLYCNTKGFINSMAMDIDFLKCEAEVNKGRKHFHLMVKPIGPVCNLRCKYCYYIEKSKIYNKKNPEYVMSDEVLEAYIKGYIDSQPTENPRVVFAWQGGEPTLLGIDFFEKALLLQKNILTGERS